jgi:hypothetical protein
VPLALPVLHPIDLRHGQSPWHPNAPDRPLGMVFATPGRCHGFA